jgi:hypothetical protein
VPEITVCKYSGSDEIISRYFGKETADGYN